MLSMHGQHQDECRHKPDDRGQPQERRDAEDHDARETSEDIRGVDTNRVDGGLESTAQFLPRSDEHERNQHEERASQQLDREDEFRGVFEPGVRAEIDQLRRLLAADVDHEPI